MRPVKLELTAFGSYAQTTTVPFDRLTRGLYLITGDTGAGKTTIFDGIVFALYGKASGSDREASMMHCDLVEKSVDTAVVLTFLQDGKTYTVTRTIHFPKKRKTGDYGKPEIDALLTGEDMSPIKGATPVTERCEALVGLNAEQFRKIVMLAQGEFREFLKADSDNKNRILGKLFDSSPYVYLQELLRQSRDRLEQERRGHRDRLNQLLDPLAQEAGGEAGLYLPEHPALLENLGELTRGDRQALAELETLRETQRRALNRLHSQKGQAEQINRALEDLERKRQTLAGLEARAGEMGDRQQRLNRLEAALHRALPPILARRQGERDLEAARQGVESWTRQAAAAEQALEEARLQSQQDPALEQRQEALRQERTVLFRQLQRYGTLRELEYQAAQLRTELERLRGNRDGLQQEAERLQVLHGALEEALARLQDIDTLAERRNQAWQERKRGLELWCGPQGIRARALALWGRDRELRKQGVALMELSTQAAQAHETANSLYQRFLQGQAGLLAADLRREVQRQGAGDCPVCGCRVGRDQLSALAQPQAGTPDREFVDRARREADRLERDRRRRQEEYSEAQAALEGEKAALVTQARSLRPDCESWDRLSSREYQDQTRTLLEQALTQAQQELDQAREAQTWRDAQRKEAERLNRQIQDNRKRLEDYGEALMKTRIHHGALTSQIQGLTQELQYTSENQAREKEQTLARQDRELTALLTAHRQALSQGETGLAAARASLQEANRALLRAETGLRQAREAEAGALGETGFADADAVTQALAPAGDQDPEQWLQTERTALEGWTREREGLGAAIAALEAQTQGKTSTDLEALQAQIGETDRALRQTERDWAQADQRLRRHLEIQGQAAQCRAALAATDGAWDRLDRLGTLAVGAAGQGGKLSFDRYVMGAVFRDILEMANRRLDLISGGRYELLHKTAADHAAAKAGLEIEILDVSTGKRRPSASLSGGEAFYTSLALALGLSDVVQNYAGGKKLEALFIDEGFGSLSDDMLAKALEVLDQLTRGDRLVGVISHVDKLSASIPQKLLVKNGPAGSSLRVEV